MQPAEGPSMGDGGSTRSIRGQAIRRGAAGMAYTVRAGPPAGNLGIKRWPTPHRKGRALHKVVVGGRRLQEGGMGLGAGNIYIYT